MVLETFFTEEDIQEIYNDVLVYSILKYRKLDKGWKKEFLDRYERARKYFFLRGIEPSLLENVNLEQLRDKLMNYQIFYDSILKLNKGVIIQSGNEIGERVVSTISKKESEFEKISFLFDFITNYVHYSEDYFHYCLDVPPVDGRTFDFKNCVPVDSSIEGMLVMGQGVCDDICNLFLYLGRKLQLDIMKVIGHYNGYLHSFNAIMLKDDNCYFIDATRLIRGDMKKEECFLVSRETLNKECNYQFKDELVVDYDYKGEYLNYEREVEELIQDIYQISPQIKNLNYSRKNYR